MNKLYTWYCILTNLKLDYVMYIVNAGAEDDMAGGNYFIGQ